MNEPIINDQILTQYLLGMLDERKKEDIEGRIFANDAYYNQLLLLEDELIDEYVHEHLSKKERKYFEKNFLLSPERYKKINFAKNLRKNLNRLLMESSSKLQKLSNFAKNLRENLNWLLMESGGKSMELSNIELIKLLVHSPDNSLAWNEFYRRFDDKIRLIVQRYSQMFNPKTNLDDLVNDFYVSLIAHDLRALKQFRGQNDNSIYTFLSHVARKVVSMDRVRLAATKRRTTLQEREPGLLLVDMLADPHMPNPDEKLMLESLRQEVESILDEILTNRNKERERDKAIFKMFVFEELSATNIAQRFNLSPQRVRNIIITIRKKIGEKSSKKP